MISNSKISQVGAFPADASAEYKSSKFKISQVGHYPQAPLRNIFLPNIKNVVSGQSYPSA